MWVRLPTMGHVCVLGAAGTGKSYTIDRYIKGCGDNWLAIGKTASSIARYGMRGWTYCRWIGSWDWEYGEETVIVVEEVGMFNAVEWGELWRRVRGGCRERKIVSCGDVMQLGEGDFFMSRAWREEMDDAPVRGMQSGDWAAQTIGTPWMVGYIILRSQRRATGELDLMLRRMRKGLVNTMVDWGVWTWLKGIERWTSRSDVCGSDSDEEGEEEELPSIDGSTTSHSSSSSSSSSPAPGDDDTIHLFYTNKALDNHPSQDYWTRGIVTKNEYRDDGSLVFRNGEHVIIHKTHEYLPRELRTWRKDNIRTKHPSVPLWYELTDMRVTPYLCDGSKSTIHRVQGETLNRTVVIHLDDIYDCLTLYVALSRVTRVEDIRLSGSLPNGPRTLMLGLTTDKVKFIRRLKC